MFQLLLLVLAGRRIGSERVATALRLLALLSQQEGIPRHGRRHLLGFWRPEAPWESETTRVRALEARKTSLECPLQGCGR